MGLLYGENFIVLTSTVFDGSTCVTDRRTDGRTGDIIHVYSALSIMLCCRALKTNGLDVYKLNDTTLQFRL